MRRIAAACLVVAPAGLAMTWPAAAMAGPRAGDARSLSGEDRDAILAAAGFRLTPGRAFWIWNDPDDPENECDASMVEIVELRDRNGDGRADALIAANGPCYEDQGPDHMLVAATVAGWRLVARDLGRQPRFYPRAGIEWPDIERDDGDATGCQPFVRWDGVRYSPGGTSNKGRICEPDDRSTAAD